MSEALNTVYDALLMGHIRQPKGYGLPEGSKKRSTIHNPLCGDSLTLAHAESVRFECECCGISMGSTSLMTVMVSGLPLAEIKVRIEAAYQVLCGASPDAAWVEGVTESLRDEAWAGWKLLYEIGQTLPSRRTCASLGWQALEAALGGLDTPQAREIKP